MRNRSLSSFERLLHISEAITKIEGYSKDVTLKIFVSNPLINDAILLQFMIIGEAINSVETEILEKYPYPWYKVRAFRNLIAHEYFKIKLDAVWDIVIKDIPELKKVIETIVKSEKFNKN